MSMCMTCDGAFGSFAVGAFANREFAFRFLYCRGAGHIDSLIFHFVLINDFENVAFLMSV